MKITEQRNELRGLTVEDLRTRVRDLDDQIFRLRIQRATGQAEAGNKMRPLRKQLARIKTLLGEKGVKD
jgi:large subunit ribosomal protein L29